MVLTKKKLLKIAVVSFILTFVIRLLTVASFLGIYSCQTSACINQNSSHIKIVIGGILQFITFAIFLISLVMYFVYTVQKRP